MKNRKMNWLNVILLILLCICIYIIIHDLLTLTVISWIKEKMATFTIFGLITFLIAATVGGFIIGYFIEYYEKQK